MQLVAPHAPPVHAAVQQLPLPATPHTPLVHWLLPPQPLPAPSLPTQRPLGPGLKQKLVLGDAQSLSLPHVVRHDVELAQLKPPGHGPAVPGVQPPEPLHAPAGVKVEPEHDALPHDVEPVG